MAVLPDTKAELIEFSEAHLQVWTSPAAIGLTAAQITALSALTDTARKDYDDSLVKRDVSKASTVSSNASVRLMKNQLADMIRSIKAFAEASSNPDAVYGTAVIPPPAAPSPPPAPGKPNNTNVTLNTGGSITLSWDADNAAASSGVIYTVMRQLPGQSAYTLVGYSPGSTTQSRRMAFTDETIPTSAAAQGATYIITGRRNNQVGVPSDAITVQFGIGGTGATVTGATLTMAA